MKILLHCGLSNESSHHTGMSRMLQKILGITILMPSKRNTQASTLVACSRHSYRGDSAKRCEQKKTAHHPLLSERLVQATTLVNGWNVMLIRAK